MVRRWHMGMAGAKRTLNSRRQSWLLKYWAFSSGMVIMENAFKSGFIGIVGPTNSGKSTLLNALIGKKVSIVSPRVQTTYHPIRGILNFDSSQLVFTDTPGF